jgi:hypothetical protein
MTIVKDPQILKNVFSDEDFKVLKEYLLNKEKNNYEDFFGRYLLTDPFIDEYAKKLIPLAKNIFNSKNLNSSYSLFAHYEGKDANLFKHKDNNACTYTIDLCIYQNEPWELWVENKPYLLNENQALAYYGEDQEHWRNPIPNPLTQKVAMIFFHFVEPDHWWFLKGKDYIDVVQMRISEEEWNIKHGV